MNWKVGLGQRGARPEGLLSVDDRENLRYAASMLGHAAPTRKETSIWPPPQVGRQPNHIHVGVIRDVARLIVQKEI